MHWIEVRDDINLALAKPEKLIFAVLKPSRLVLKVPENMKNHFCIFSHDSTTLSLSLARGASVDLEWICFGGEFANDLQITLGENSNVKIRGAGKFNTNDKISYNYSAQHLDSNSQSDFVFFGSLDDNAQKNSTLKIDFVNGAKNCIGNEREDMILLGENVKNRCIPQIVCAESDVVGNHGLSCGHIDDDTRNYLESRGISEKQAKTTIANARILQVVKDMRSQKALQYLERFLNV